MKLSEFIKKSWTYIDHPSKWIAGRRQDFMGHYCSIGALEACAVELRRNGEISRAESVALYEKATAQLNQDVPEGYGGSIVTLNDNAGWSPTRRSWQRTVQRLEATGH